jgi:hypothetical protein
MNPRLILTVAALAPLLCAAAGLRAQSPTSPAPLNPAALFTPANQIQVGKMPAVIKRMFARLAHDDAQAIPFTESRAFSISKNPIRQAGTLRSSRQYGLSLAYEGAKPHTIIIDDKGLIDRQPNGRERQINVADHPELSALTDLYLNLLRGNAARLFDYADVYFAGEPRRWQLGLISHDAAVAKRAGRVVISGNGRNILRLDNILPNGDMRSLELGKADRNPRFTPEQTQAFFRREG